MATYICCRCDATVEGYHRRCPQCRCYQCTTPAPYLPTKDEIAAQCEAIQATWSEYEKRRRRREPECGVEILDLWVGWNRVSRREYRD